MPRAVLTLFLLALLLRLALVPTDALLRSDQYRYFLKAEEFSKGDFIPMPHNSPGWSLFMAPFFTLTPPQSHALLARFLSAVVGAAIIIPLWLLAQRLLDVRGQLILLVLFVFSPHLILSSGGADSEALFTLLLTGALCFLLRAEKPLFLLYASAVAGLAHYVKSNGILLLPVLLASAWLLRDNVRGYRHLHLLAIAAVFLAVSTPLFAQRMGRFSYGVAHPLTQRLLAESEDDTHDPYYQEPSLKEYLQVRGASGLFRRFIGSGLLVVLFFHLFFLLSPVLLFFVVYGVIKSKRAAAPLLITMATFILFFSAIFPLHQTPRYFYPVLPLWLLFGAHGVREALGRRTTLVSVLLMVFALYSLITPVAIRVGQPHAFQTPVGMWYTISHGSDSVPEWARWAASHVRGTLAVQNNGDLVMMQLPDTRASGYGQEATFVAPESGLRVTMVPMVTGVAQARETLKRWNITHIAIDAKTLQERPYLAELSPYLIEILPPTEPAPGVFAINWSAWSSEDKATIVR